MNGWKTILSYWVPVTFQGRTVKLQEGIHNCSLETVEFAILWDHFGIVKWPFQRLLLISKWGMKRSLWIRHPFFSTSIYKILAICLVVSLRCFTLQIRHIPPIGCAWKKLSWVVKYGTVVRYPALQNLNISLEIDLWNFVNFWSEKWVARFKFLSSEIEHGEHVRIKTVLVGN